MTTSMVPTSTHADRVSLLSVVADLVGCYWAYRCPLPDACRPDIVRFDPWRRVIFLGEAKATETSGDTRSWSRLHNYVGWLATIVMDARVGTILALCVPADASVVAWTRIIDVSCAEHGISLRPVRPLRDHDHRVLCWCG